MTEFTKIQDAAVLKNAAAKLTSVLGGFTGDVLRVLVAVEGGSPVPVEKMAMALNEANLICEALKQIERCQPVVTRHVCGWKFTALPDSVEIEFSGSTKTKFRGFGAVLADVVRSGDIEAMTKAAVTLTKTPVKRLHLVETGFGYVKCIRAPKKEQTFHGYPTVVRPRNGAIQ